MSEVETTENVNAGHLRAFIERIERLEEEKKGFADDIKEVYGEAKGTGFDTKIIKAIIKIRAMDRDKRKEQEEILDLYMSALGISWRKWNGTNLEKKKRNEGRNTLLSFHRVDIFLFL